MWDVIVLIPDHFLSVYFVSTALTCLFGTDTIYRRSIKQLVWAILTVMGNGCVKSLTKAYMDIKKRTGSMIFWGFYSNHRLTNYWIMNNGE